MLIKLKNGKILDLDKLNCFIREAKGVVEMYEDAIDTHIYDEGEEPDDAPERAAINDFHSALRELFVSKRERARRGLVE